VNIEVEEEEPCVGYEKVVFQEVFGVNKYLMCFHNAHNLI
jgi:hypothetical protein